MNIELSEKYDYSSIAKRLCIAADNLESLGIVGKTECNNFIKKTNLNISQRKLK